VYFTVFSNQKTTARYIKEKWANKEQFHMNIIASHPTGEDDIACAHYMKGIIEGASQVSAELTGHQIQNSSVAKKFYDPCQTSFNQDDMDFCLREMSSSFVMKINKAKALPTIERVDI
jgi:2-phosphosulfolactate phosphatase